MVNGTSLKKQIKQCGSPLSLPLSGYRAAAKAKLSTDALLAELKSSMVWNESAMATLKHLWKEEGPSLITVPTLSLSIGQVRKKEWPGGVSLI